MPEVEIKPTKKKHLTEYHLHRFGFLHGKWKHEYELFFWNKSKEPMKLQLYFNDKTLNYNYRLINFCKPKKINVKKMTFVDELKNIYFQASNEELKYVKPAK